jgi:hypothetical protein
MRFGEVEEEGSERWWSDVAPMSGGFRASLVRRRAASSSGRALTIPAPRRAQAREGAASGLWLLMPETLPGETFEGFTTTASDVFAVRASGTSDSVVIWRKRP